MTRRLPLLASTLLFLLPLQPKAQAESFPRVGGGEPRDGIQEVTLRHEWTLGSEDMLIGQIGSIAVDDEGTVFVLDGQLGEVQVISADGTWLRSIGRAGEGPGEFRQPNDMFLTHDGNVAVVQQQPAKVALIAKDGTTLDDATLPDATDGFRFLLRGLPTNDGFALATAMLTPSQDGGIGTKVFVETISTEGKLIGRLFGVDSSIDMVEGTVPERSIDNISMYWAVTTDDRIAGRASFDEYAIEVRSLDGTPLYEIRRDVPARRRTAEELENAGDGFDMTINEREIEMIPEPNARMIDWISARPDGVLWAMLRETAEIDGAAGRAMRIDAFDAQGTYLRQLVVRGNVPHEDRIRIVGDSAFVIHEPEDEEDGEITLSCFSLEGLRDPELRP